MSDNILDPVYPRLTAATLETAATNLTMRDRNNERNPELTTALRQAAAKTCETHGVVGDTHLDAVTDRACAWVFEALPSKYVDVGGSIPNPERTMASHAEARRDWIINLFGATPLRLLAAWLTHIARNHD